jgi:hypothetical protein
VIHPTSIYTGPLKSVPYASIQPPAKGKEAFIADVARRCPGIELFSSAVPFVRVLGVFPEHFTDYAKDQKWTFVNDTLWNGSKEKQRRTANSKTNCFQRPSLWHMRDSNGKEFFIFCTEPCREAVCHWASMLDQLFRSHNIACSIITSYHEGSTQKFVSKVIAESGVVHQLNTLKNLSARKVILILGYVSLAETAIEDIRFPAESIECGPLIHLKVWKNSSAANLVAMTVRFSFRGSIGKELVSQLRKACDLGGVLFVTKVAQHISKTYQGCVIPSAYSIVSPEGTLPRPVISTRSLLERWTSRAVHMSAATTLLPQSFIEKAMRQGANTTGTEIAYFANGAGNIPFQALCLASDNPLNYLPILTVIFKEVAALGNSVFYRQPSTKYFPSSGTYDGPLKELPLQQINPNSHSMGEDIVAYARSKGPSLEILKNLPIKVLGIAPEDLSTYAESRGWKLDNRPLWDGSTRIQESYYAAFLPPKSGNTQRPSLFHVIDENGKEFLLLSTMPSEELVHHWGMLIRQYFPHVTAAIHKGSMEHFAQKCVR